MGSTGDCLAQRPTVLGTGGPENFFVVNEHCAISIGFLLRPPTCNAKLIRRLPPKYRNFRRSGTGGGTKMVLITLTSTPS